MIQELGDKRLYNEFETWEARPEDKVFAFCGQSFAVEDGEPISLPTAEQFADSKLQYLFRIGEERYFLLKDDTQLREGGFKLQNIRDIRNTGLRELSFAAATAYHLRVWYRDNRFCGRCGGLTVHSAAERALKCPECGNTIYPKVAPAVIIGLTDGDKILLTKYNGRAYKRYALIAGFTEIGETLEETVRREVMEEVGLKAKNIRYYKSQPWGTDSNVLMGFFADVDGDTSITMDQDELSVAEWHRRDELGVEDDGYSITREMMRVFKEGNEKER